MKIVGAWETPANEGTAVFRVGERCYYPSRSKVSTERWVVGAIKLEQDFTTEGVFVHIYDTNGVVRIDIPSNNVALEWEEGNDN